MAKANGYKYVELSVDEIPCENVSDMAALLNCNTWEVYHAIRHNKTTLKGHNLSYDIKPGNWRPHKNENTVKIEKKHITTQALSEDLEYTVSKKSVPVKCTTTGQIFKSITDVAKIIGINSWTMGLKMEKAGKFIDKDGNEYVRLKPMQQRSDRDYGNVHPDLLRKIPHYTKKTSVKAEETQIVPATSEKMHVTDDVVGNLKASVFNLIDCKKYNEASTILTVLGALDK